MNTITKNKLRYYKALKRITPKQLKNIMFGLGAQAGRPIGNLELALRMNMYGFTK